MKAEQKKNKIVMGARGGVVTNNLASKLALIKKKKELGSEDDPDYVGGSNSMAGQAAPLAGLGFGRPGASGGLGGQGGPGVGAGFGGLGPPIGLQKSKISSGLTPIADTLPSVKDEEEKESESTKVSDTDGIKLNFGDDDPIPVPVQQEQIEVQMSTEKRYKRGRERMIKSAKIGVLNFPEAAKSCNLEAPNYVLEKVLNLMASGSLP